MTEYNTLAEALEANALRHKGAATRKAEAIKDRHKPVKLLSEETMNVKYRRCHRAGKTARYRANGGEHNRHNNRTSRASYTRWCSDHASHAASTATAVAKFSEYCGSCNGKKTRALRA